MVFRLGEQKMGLIQRIKSKFVKMLWLMLWMPSAFAAVLLEYQSPMGEEDWHMSGNRLRCGMAFTVPNYGIAYFEQFATKRPRFFLTNWQQVTKPISAIVFASPPVWKPGGQTFEIARTSVNPGEFAVYLPNAPTIKMMNYLSQGYQTRLRYLSEEGFPISIGLSPIKFQRAYARYKRCLGNLLPFTFKNVELSIILFNNDSYELSDQSKQQLRRIAEYVAADRSVKQVKIVGYTDDKGRKSYNNAVSEARAHSVESYLLSIGLPEKRMFVTWKGVKDPLASNTTEKGRAFNRRVVVRLYK